MKLINLLTRIISEQPAKSDEPFFRGLVTSEEYDGNIFELMTDRHGIDRALFRNRTDKKSVVVEKPEIIDKFQRAVPEMNKRFFGDTRTVRSPIIDGEYNFRDSKSGARRVDDAPKFVIVKVKDHFFQMVLIIKNYDKNSNYISFEIVTILKNGTPLSNLYNPKYHVQKLNIFLEHVVRSEIIHIFV
jgi:hypothetical protein